VFFSDILPKQAISADDRRSAGEPLPSRSVNDHQVIAYSVEMVLVATRQPGRKIADGSAVSKENLVTKLLQAFYVPLVACKADLEATDRAEFRR
jgi:hypothetical protein